VGTVDAIVAATTARRGGTLYTTDPADHLRLAEHFRTLKVCAVPAAG
jgi:predicted nucleic acid-binding protein